MMVPRIGGQETGFPPTFDGASVDHMKAVDLGKKFHHFVHVEDMKPSVDDGEWRRLCHGGGSLKFDLSNYRIFFGTESNNCLPPALYIVN